MSAFLLVVLVAAEPIPFVEVTVEGEIVFDRHIYPLLSAKCTVCHDAEGGLAEADLDLLTVAALQTGGKRGPAIVPGNGEDSLLIRMAAHRLKPFMPPKDEEPLTSEELSLIKRWIDEGAKPGENPAPAMREEDPLVLEPLPPGLHPVYALDIHGTKLLAVGRANQVFLYDLENGTLHATLAGHEDLIHSLRFSPDGRHLAAGGYRKILVWPIQPAPAPDPAPAPEEPAPQDPATETSVPEAAEPAKDPATPEEPAPAPPPPPAPWIIGEPIELGPLADRVLALDFSPDGTRLAAAGGLPTSTGEVVVYSLESREPLWARSDVHSDTVLGLAFSPDGNRLATGAADKFARILNAASGETQLSLEGHTHHVLGVVWKPDGGQLVTASGDQTLKSWNLELGEQIRTVAGHGKEVTGVRWLPGADQYLSACGDRHVRLINNPDGGIPRAFGGPADALHALAVSTDGQRIAGGAQDGKVTIWQTADAKVLHVLEQPQPTAGK